MVRKILSIAIGVVLMASGLAAQSQEKIWYFDGDKTGGLPEGFTNEVGEWGVVTDETAPSKPNVLAQLSKNSGSTFNLTLASDGNYKDVDLSVKMKAVAGRKDQGGGLIWHAKDAKNYYVARYNPLEDNYRIYKVENGRRRQLRSVDIKHTDGCTPCAWSCKGNTSSVIRTAKSTWMQKIDLSRCWQDWPLDKVGCTELFRRPDGKSEMKEGSKHEVDNP